MMRHLSLFSGIGGFDLGLRNTSGYETVAFCEPDPFCQKILAKHWPGVPCYDDVRMLNYDRLRTDGIADIDIDIISGGFPCQTVSLAGKQLGEDDARWLWPEYCRLIREVRPRWVVAENVPGLVSNSDGRLFRGILRDLAESGYDALWRIISAADVGAPHLRKRIWIIAHAQSEQVGISRQSRGHNRLQCVFTDSNSTNLRQQSGRGCGEDGKSPAWSGAESKTRSTTDANNSRLKEQRVNLAEEEGLSKWEDRRLAESVLCRVDHGISRRLDGSIAGICDWPTLGVSPITILCPARSPRLRSLGNSIVPQIAQIIGAAILDAEAGLELMEA